MALQKQNISINFAQGLDTKTDPNQVQTGKMLALQNSIFTKAGLLQKRNGYKGLPTLPDNSSVSIGTFNGNLITVGTSLNALSQDSQQWINCGKIQPVKQTVLPVVRSATSQETVDIAIASNSLACATWMDSDGNSYYQIVDSSSGQIIVPSTLITAGATMPRVFALGFNFIITFLISITATPHLQYISIPTNNPAMASSAVNVSSQVSSTSAGYDGVVFNNNLYLAWDGSDLGGAIRATFITSFLSQASTSITTGHTSTLMSLAASVSGGNTLIWISFWDSTSTNGYTMAKNFMLAPVLAPTQIITTTAISALTSIALSSNLTVFYQKDNTYSFSSTRSDLLEKLTVSSAGTVSSTSVVLRGVGIASKAFYFSDTSEIYLLLSYGQSFQPTYFLSDQNGNLISKLAYSNGAGYAFNQILPSVTVTGSLVQVGYLFKDLLVSVNKAQGVSSATGVYSQKGINLANFTISDSVMATAEIGNNLNLAGGFLWMYDGVKPVEQGFHVWPEDVDASTSTTGGFVTDQQYYYQFVYEWTDAQGNIHRSAPSIPVGVLTAGGGTSTNTLHVPTLRLTYKTGLNKVRIVGYRWSAGQQIYYQFTSISSPVMNDPSVDFVTITDTLADSSILGNVILYTTGGVVEDIAPPACSSLALFKSRLFLVDAEDPNLIWYSKQVIQATPVEMSDLFTIYVASTIGAQGSTGPITALSALDDKLIIFKKDAIYYITGNGPDNTGANNDFSDPVFITGTVGCANQQSIVFCPQGLIFESDKGRWLLGRDLQTSYLGAPVEAYNSATTESAINVPGTNQVRLTLDNGVTLMYDYFYNQWGTFNNIPAISSTIYQGLHTYLNNLGQVFQETQGLFLDGSSPVLMSFTTAWLSLAGLQGYERGYFFYLLASYLTPHKLNVQIAYDFDSSVVQATLISPQNFSAAYGGDSLYGGSSPYGGPSSVEQFRVFLERQKCQSFQITITEVYDPSFGVAAGGGFTMSGINLVIGTKSGYPRLPSAQYVG